MQHIEGLSLEGVDYAGKTTIAKLLERDLTENDVRVTYKKDYLIQDGISAGLIELGEEISPPNVAQDLYFVLAKLIDRFRMEDLDFPEFIIQDRYFFSTLNHCSFFYLNKDRSIMSLLDYSPRFKMNFYLTSNIETKKQRFRNNPPENDFDKLLFENPELHQEYDDFCLSNVPGEDFWKIIETDDMTINEIANIILDTI